jgi:hypothetical protein
VNADLNNCIARVRIMNRVLRRLLMEVTDDPVRHLKRCKCGRSETRFAKCVQCLQDGLKNELKA